MKIIIFISLFVALVLSRTPQFDIQDPLQVLSRCLAVSRLTVDQLELQEPVTERNPVACFLTCLLEEVIVNLNYEVDWCKAEKFLSKIKGERVSLGEVRNFFNETQYEDCAKQKEFDSYYCKQSLEDFANCFGPSFSSELNSSVTEMVEMEFESMIGKYRQVIIPTLPNF